MIVQPSHHITRLTTHTRTAAREPQLRIYVRCSCTSGSLRSFQSTFVRFNPGSILVIALYT